MKETKRNWYRGLGMIWAIALKDIGDAIQNKTILGIMIGVAFMMLSSQALSLLVKGQSEPAAELYDMGKSTQIRELVRSREYRIGLSDSFEEMEEVVSQSPDIRLGIELPANFDEVMNSQDFIELQGYYPHWANRTTIADRVIYFEELLSRAIGISVRIQVSGNSVYPSPDEIGYSVMISTGIVMGVMTIGLILTPILIIDEKETHTLDVLLLSPARIRHMLIGKSLVGLFYAMIASMVIFVISGCWIVHWWVVIPAVLLGALCAVVTGLLIGSIIDNFATVNLWIGLIIVFFLLPVFLWSSIAPKLPELLQTTLRWLPSLAMFKLVSISLAETVSIQQILALISAMVVFILLMLLIVAWWIRYQDR
jgi:ABC-2 type transport system permease protein